MYTVNLCVQLYSTYITAGADRKCTNVAVQNLIDQLKYTSKNKKSQIFITSACTMKKEVIKWIEPRR